MTNKERNSRRTTEEPTGSLERMHFSDEEIGEKSLLRLIQERAATSNRHLEVEGNTCAATLNEIDRDEPIGLENMIIRLGGNGF